MFIVEDHSIEITISGNMETTIVPVIQQRNSFYCPNAKDGKSSEVYCQSYFSQVRDNEISGYDGWRTGDELTRCIVRKEVVLTTVSP